MSASSLSRYSSANPDVAIDRRSPPLPFTAITRCDWPVRGSAASNFELVFPPPKFVMRRSSPSRFERYRSRSSGDDSIFAASRSSHRFCRNVVSLVEISDTGQLHVIEEAAVMRGPAIGGHGLEPLRGKRMLDDPARFANRADGARCEHLHADVAERGRFDRPGDHGPPGRIGGELVQQPVARSAADNLHFGDWDSGERLQRIEDDAVLEGETLEYGARIGRGTRRFRLTGAIAVLRNGARHVRRMQERGIVWIEQRRERVAVVAGRIHQLRIIVVMP